MPGPGQPQVSGGTALAVAAGAVAVAVLALWRRKQQKQPAASQGNVYETVQSVHEYLLMHYGKPHELLPYEFGPHSALEFPARCAEECVRLGQQLQRAQRALDVGCAVGRSSFEMARFFPEVVGIDYSHAFVEAANELKRSGRSGYRARTEGDLSVALVAEVPPDIDRSRVHFLQGDACDLPQELGQFDVVLAANLVCRLPKPRLFFERLPSLVTRGGYLVMPSPYTWLEQFTPKSEWLGGYVNAEGKEVKTFDTFKRLLAEHFELVLEKNMPFFIRETARKNQWSVSHLTVWRRR